MKPIYRCFGCRPVQIALLLTITRAFVVHSQPAGSEKETPRARPNTQFGEGPKPGTKAPDFELQTVEGKTVKASVLWSNKPTLIMNGSHTCPVFRGKVPSFEELVRDFANQLNFIVLYTIEAHPKGDPSPYTGREWVTEANEKSGILFRQPKDIAERTERARTCASALGIKALVVVDRMENSVWKAYGSAPNSACLVGKDGMVIEREGWFDQKQMRAAINKVVNTRETRP